MSLSELGSTNSNHASTICDGRCRGRRVVPKKIGFSARTLAAFLSLNRKEHPEEPLPVSRRMPHSNRILTARSMSAVKIYNLTDHWYPDKIGGSCIYAYKLHRLLMRQSQIETVTIAGQADPRESEMVVHKVLHKSKVWRNVPHLRQLDCQDAIWIVHSPWFYLHLAVALGPGIGRRTVGVYHGPWFREYLASAAAKTNRLMRYALAAFRYLIEVFYCLSVRRFVFLSETMYRATSKYLPLARSRVSIIPMWREAHPLSCERKVNRTPLMSTFRRLEPRMGLQDLINALGRLDIQDYRLVICGDGPYREELIRLVAESELTDRVEFRGWVEDEEKQRIISESDAVLIPSRSLEGFSLLALEALEVGTPVVVTKEVGFYEYVRDLEQDYVKCIDWDRPKLELQDFLLKRRRRGLGRILDTFDEARVRQAFLKELKIDSSLPFCIRRPNSATLEATSERQAATSGSAAP